jgi:hypothetical protein
LPGDTAPIASPRRRERRRVADRVFTTPSGVFARYNLGYRFASAPVQLATGGFESQESYAGGLSLGFTTPWAEFSGGAALNWNVDLSRYAWNDVNGDRILDQIHKIDGAQPTVRFGTGTGMLNATPYGNMPEAEILDIGTGQQVAFDRTNGLGGQFDFEVAIGPLCLVACYLIINPGASTRTASARPRLTCRTSTATATPTRCRRSTTARSRWASTSKPTPTCWPPSPTRWAGR